MLDGVEKPSVVGLVVAAKVEFAVVAGVVVGFVAVVVGMQRWQLRWNWWLNLIETVAFVKDLVGINLFA